MIIELIAVAIAGQSNPVSDPTAQNPPVDPIPPAVRAQPLQNLSLYVEGGDYPPGAFRRNEQGRVGFELRISPAGRATDCAITRSSGSTELDRRTCQIMLQRARFRPARDGRGNPVSDVIAATIGWVLSP
jgi:protein TonB